MLFFSFTLCLKIFYKIYLETSILYFHICIHVKEENIYFKNISKLDKISQLLFQKKKKEIVPQSMRFYLDYAAMLLSIPNSSGSCLWNRVGVVPCAEKIPFTFASLYHEDRIVNQYFL